MLELTYKTNISLAGIPVQVWCQYKENIDFFKDYITDENPWFSVEPDPSEYNRIQNRFEKSDIAEGRIPFQRPNSILENSLIHSLITEKMVSYNVLLMHGSAICLDNKGIIFTAKSGTGKSTHTRLWKETFGDRVCIINDDKPFLRISDRSVYVYGSPWDGKHHLSKNISAKLDTIVVLNRSEENRIVSISKIDAFPIVLSLTYNSSNPETMRKIMKLQHQLIESVDFYKLYCNTDKEAAVTAYQGISISLF